MGKHHKSSNNPSTKPTTSNGLGNFGGFNIGDLLKNIDINQIISLLSSFVGAKNMNTNQLSSMIRNLDLNDMGQEANSSKVDVNKLQSQLSLLADRLDEIDGGKNANVHDELLNAVQNLQNTPGGSDAVLDFIKSNLNAGDEGSNNKRGRK
ncbi:hypothetical protein JMF89_13020 [Clostridiaceae bacterium UIB06]|nr:hypothetical protein [Clostridiaceae bacterium UIB06]